MGLDAMILVFLMLSFKPSFSLSSFTLLFRFHQEALQFFFTFCHKSDVICISEVIDISPSNLDSSLCFIQPGISHDAYKLNKESDNIQPWCTPFPILNQSIIPCPVLTVASWPAYRLLWRQVRWSGIPISLKNFPQFLVIYTVKDFSIVNKAEVDVFLEFSCFFHDPADVSNLISGSSAFSKSSLSIWTFTVHTLLKPGLENFEHYSASVWMSAIVQ